MLYLPQIGRHRRVLRRWGFEELLHKRLIFTVATGRCGTGTLYHAFRLAKDTESTHEPFPLYSICLRQVQRDPQQAWDFLLEKKFPEILNRRAPCYVETSHLVCKGFIEPILELGLRPHFLILQRNFRDVAKSFLLIDSIPERTELGRNYMVSPADPSLLEIPGWERLTDYQLCYWYALEMHQRAEWYAALFDRLGIGYTRFDFSNIACPRAVTRLMTLSGATLPHGAEVQLADLLARPINCKEEDKARVGRQAEVADSRWLEECETAVVRLCRLRVPGPYRFRPRRLRKRKPLPVPCAAPAARPPKRFLPGIIFRMISRCLPAPVREVLKGNAAVWAFYHWMQGS
jgi:hypothetical protein